MFSLIITIISIALVAALAVATIYYGGTAFTQGTAKANASALVAAGQQVNGALALYANDNGGARGSLVVGNATYLVPTYLAAAPKVQGTTLTVNAADVTTVGVKDSVCAAIATSATGATVEIAALATRTAQDASLPYDCFRPATGAADNNTFVFKG